MRNNKSLFLAALLATTALCGLAQAQNGAQDGKLGLYVTPSLGVTFAQTDNLRVSDYAVGGATQQFSTRDDSDTALRLGLAAGYNLKKLTGLPIRLELDGAWHSRVEGKGTLSYTGDTYSEAHILKVSALTGLVNAFYDLPIAGRFGVYGGGGLGVARLRLKSSFTAVDSAAGALGSSSGSLGNRTETNFAWQLGLGATYALNKTLTVDLGYRYVDMGDIKTGSTNSFTRLPMQGKLSLTGHDLLLGVRVGF